MPCNKEAVLEDILTISPIMPTLVANACEADISVSGCNVLFCAEAIFTSHTFNGLLWQYANRLSPSVSKPRLSTLLGTRYLPVSGL